MTHPLAQYIKPREWHENRRQGLGGSDATILAEGDSEKINELWAIKTGRKQPEPLLILPVLMGVLTEDLNVAWFQSVTGREVWDCGGERVHPSFSWLRASLDGVTTSRDGREAYMECKTVGAFWKPENLVKKYYAQLQHVMMVGSWEVSLFSAIIGNNKHFYTEVEYDPWWSLELFELERDFWACVTENREPGLDIMRGLR